MSDDGELIVIPKRRDGTAKVFFYDPKLPGHIIHNFGTDKNGYAMLRTICVGHCGGD